MKKSEPVRSAVPSDSQTTPAGAADDIDVNSATLAGAAPPKPVRPQSSIPPAEAAPPSPEDANSVELKPGTAIGRYLLLGRLGEGGMGVVYAAFDTQLERKVAIKLLHPQNGTDGTQGRARLLREAQVLAQLANPNVVSIYDVGTYQSQVFIAMEFIDGGTLSSWLTTKPRTPAEILEVFQQAGRGLSAAHTANFIHRDFKPDNVLIGTDQRVRVTDFGVARLVSLEAGPINKPDLSALPMPSRSSGLQTPLTSADALIGTPLYMAPEQFDGRPTDARTDQFSFCVSLYQAFYDQPAFAGDTLAALYKNVLHGKVQGPPATTQVPAWLHKVLLRGLSPDPNHRFASMDELLRALFPPRRTSWRTKAVMAGAMVAALAAGGFAVAALERRRDPCAKENLAAKKQHDKVWGDPVRKPFLSALKVPNSSVLTWAGDDLLRRIDGYANDWLSAKRNICRDVRQGLKIDERDQRTSCLEHRLAELKVVTGLLAHLDQESVQNARTAAWALTPISSCENKEALRTGNPPPPPAKIREQVESLADELAAARISEAGLENKSVLANAHELVKRAAEVDYKPLHAESLLMLGGMQQRAGERRVAAGTLDKAAMVGLASQHLRVSAEAFASLVTLASFDQNFDLADTYVRLSAATLLASGSDPLGEARIFYARGMLAMAREQLNDALTQHDKAIKLREKWLAPMHPDIAASYTGMALVYRRLHQEEAALTNQKTALKIYQSAFGPVHPRVIMAMGLLANMLVDKGEYGEALETLKQALKNNSLSKRHGSEASLYRTRAMIERAQGKYDNAITSLQKALTILQDEPANAQQDTEPLHREMSRTYLAKGDYPSAEKQAQKALDIASAAKSSPSRVLLGRARACQGQLPIARSFVQQALDASRKRLGSQSSEVADAQYFLGVIATQQGKTKEAVALHEDALKIREELSDPFELGCSLIAVAKAWTDQGRAAEAMPLLKRALKLEPAQDSQKQRLHAHAKVALAGALWEHSYRKDEEAVKNLLQAAYGVYQLPGMSEPCEQEWLARWLKKRRLGAVWESIKSPVADNPVADNLVADNPVADTPVADNPVADNPVANKDE